MDQNDSEEFKGDDTLSVDDEEENSGSGGAAVDGTALNILPPIAVQIITDEEANEIYLRMAA